MTKQHKVYCLSVLLKSTMCRTSNVFASDVRHSQFQADWARLVDRLHIRRTMGVGAVNPIGKAIHSSVDSGHPRPQPPLP